MKKITFRKPIPPRSKLLNLPDDQREKLIGWLMSGILYDEVKTRIANEFGIQFKSHRPLQHFWKKVCRPLVKQRKLGIQLPPTAGAINKGLEKMLLNPDTNIEDLKEILTLAVKAGRIELDIEKLNFKTLKKDNNKPPQPEEPNPLDDQEKLDEIRREVFGSAPNTKNSGSQSDSPQT